MGKKKSAFGQAMERKSGKRPQPWQTFNMPTSPDRRIPLSLYGESPPPNSEGLYPIYQGELISGRMLGRIEPTITMPMAPKQPWWDARNIADPQVDIIGGKPMRSPVWQTPLQLPQTTFPMEQRGPRPGMPFGPPSAPTQQQELPPLPDAMGPKDVSWSTDPIDDPVPLVMSYDQARARGYVDGGRPIEYVKPMTEPRTAGAMQPRSPLTTPQGVAPTWQQQAAGMMSVGGRAAPFRDMVPNTAPLPSQQRLMGIGVPRDWLAESAYAGSVRGINRPTTASGIPIPLRQPPMRSPTVDEPATPDEIRRAFYGPVNFAPGGTGPQAEAAQQRLGIGSDPQATLDFLRKRAGLPREVLGNTTMNDRNDRGAMINAFRTGDFSQTDAGQYARPSELDAISRLVQSTRNQHSPRPNITPPAAQPGQPGFGESYFAGQSNVTVPGVGRRASNQSLGASRVGTGIQSTGMTTGGAFGSGLMMSGAALPGMIMGAAQEQRQQPELVSRPMRGMTEITPSEFAQAWKNRKQTTGAAPDLDKMEKRRQALESRQAAVEARGMARGQARDDRMQFARDAQYYGPRGALAMAFQRQGMDPMAAMSQVAAMGGDKAALQYLSEDNRQRRAAQEFSGRTALEQERNAIERDRLEAEIEQGKRAIDPSSVALQQAGQTAYQQAISEGLSEQEAESAAAQASMGTWKRFGMQLQQPGAVPAGDTGPSRMTDAYEAQTGMSPWTTVGLPIATAGLSGLMPQSLQQWLFGSRQRMNRARQRQGQYTKP